MATIFDIQKKYRGRIDYLDLELIIAYAIRKSREFILSHPEKTVSKNQESAIKKMIGRRIEYEPLAYILGEKEFYGLKFKVNKNTLIPRPETELLIEKILKLNPKNHVIVDTGTGSGNIIISLAKNIKNKNNYVGIDISKKALEIARLNAKKHKVDKKIKFLYGNSLEPLLNKLKTEKLAIVANLPYLDIGWKNLLKSTETKGLKFEPHIALYAGKDGLDAYRKLAEQIELFSKQRKNNITVFCEIGHLQVTGMRKMFSFAKNIKFSKDLDGRWRICEIRIFNF